MLPVVVLHDLASRAVTETAESALQDGLVSNWLHNNMRPGKTICFRGVDGDFTLQLTKGIPHSGVLLVRGGYWYHPYEGDAGRATSAEAACDTAVLCAQPQGSAISARVLSGIARQAIAPGIAPVS